MKKPAIITICSIAFWVLSIPLFVQAATDIQIRHLPLFCAAKGLPAEISFEVLSQEIPEEVRVYFREQGTEPFYLTHGIRHGAGLYSALLPAPMETTTAVEYMLLVVDENELAVKSTLFVMPVDTEKMCPQEYQYEPPANIIISAEQEIESNIGFEGEHIVWATSADRLETPYMEEAVEKPVLIDEPATDWQEEQSPAEEEQSPAEEKQVETARSKSWLSSKTLIGVGAGAGAAILGAVAVGGGSSGGGGVWDSVDDEAENVEALLVKSPMSQTSCGTTVTNQLFVTNNSSESVQLGTVDYEVVLTTDSPSGSCAEGRTGAFAPSGDTTVLSGQTVLIRQWSNEVNACRGCPYMSGECVWESRYIVHTSAGSAIAFSTFTAEGDLCANVKTSQEWQAPMQSDGMP